MTIYVFVIDNSASMAQSSYAGATSLDLAKSFIEMFQKARQKESSKDRFMAISCDDYPACIKTGWRENIGTMMDQLKKLQPVGTTSLETAIGRAFWFLNCNRQYSDFPGFGWCVAKPEPAIVIALTDGVFSLGPHFIPEKIKHPSNDYYKEIYRPDQRCYGVCFRVPARPTTISTQFETASGGLANFCMTTGGKCFVVSNTRHVGIAIDAILQKSLVFVKLNFSYAGPDTDSDAAKNGSTNDDSNSKPEGLSWKETFTGILRLPRKDVESRFLWPIPENFWADYSLAQLPLRPECPNVSFTYDPKPPPSWKDGNLFDRYELEPSPLTQYILEKKSGHYPIHVVGSGRNNRNYCCGYLVAEPTKGFFTNTSDYKIADNLSRLTVILYLVPYNYQVLLSLLEEQEKSSNKKHLTPLLRQKIVDYINHVPVYYFTALESKQALLLKILLRSIGTPEEDFSRISYHNRVTAPITTWRASLRREYEISITTVHDLLKKVPDVISEIPKSKVMVDTIFARLGPACHEFTGDGPASFTIEHEPLPKLNPSALFYSAKYIPRKELIINLTKMRVNFNLYGRDHDLHVLQGGMPGQKIKLHEAGRGFT
uniref:VWFA domain-containing protein n=1 Tax=Panagrolaimus superbus TaxID=310955 RepID=A0A914YCG7_9BILA